MLSNPPSTGNVDLDNFLRSVKRHIDDALRPADGWRLSDFSADVSEVISDKRDLIDIVTRYDDINDLKDSVDLILADFAEAIADSKALENQYQDHAEVFTHTMEWWNQNRKIIEDAAEAMAATIRASDYADAAEASALRAGDHEEGASQARDDAVTAKNEAQATATQVEAQVEAAGTHAGDAQASAQDAAQSAANAADSERGAKDASASASGSASAAEAAVGAAEDAAASAKADRVVVEQAATSASWSGDRLTVLGATSPPLTGERGPKGDVGPAPNIYSGTTTTLAPGTDAYVVRTPSGENSHIFSFSIPRGDQGEQGPRGLQGPKGDPGEGTGDVLWSELNPVLDDKAPVSHEHSISEVTGLEDALASAGTAEHTHTMSEVDGLEAALDGKAAAAHQHSWGDVTGKPTTYPPEPHTHTKADITDLETISTTATANHVVKRVTSGNITVPTTPNASTSAASKSYVDQVAGGKADTSHTHTASQISNATTVGRNVLTASSQSAARSAIGAGTSNLSLGTTSSTAAAGNHTHTASSIGAAPASHQHEIRHVTGLGDALDEKVSWDDVHTAPTGSTVAYRTSSGALAVGEATEPNHAVPASQIEYVLDMLESWVESRTPEIRVVSSPSQATSPGVLYVVTGG